MKEVSTRKNKPENLIAFKKERVIKGRCRVCGGLRSFQVPKNDFDLINWLQSIKIQKCSSRDPIDTWSLLEGFIWDFSDLD